MNRLPLAAGLLATCAALLPASAYAEITGYLSSTTEMHAGPDFDYPTIQVIQDGDGVVIHGCLDDWSWCDVGYAGTRGWISGENLVADYDGQRRGLVSIAPYLGIGIVAFSFGEYWDHWYRDRPFYHQRDHWRNYTVEHRRPNWGGHGYRPGQHNDPHNNDHHDAGRPGGDRAHHDGGLQPNNSQHLGQPRAEPQHASPQRQQTVPQHHEAPHAAPPQQHGAPHPAPPPHAAAAQPHPGGGQPHPGGQPHQGGGQPHQGGERGGDEHH